MLRRMRQSTKAMLAASAALALVGALQYALISSEVDARLVVLVPLLACAPIAGIYTHIVLTYRVRGFSAALVAISHGDLDVVLPPAPDTEVDHIRAAFVRMGASLREMTERLKRVDVLRRQLFADLAHELGTPTATVVALADALALPGVDASREKRSELVEALIGEGLRLSRLVGDLRDLAELDDPEIALHRETADLASLVREVAQRLRLARPGVASIEVRAPESVMADIDEQRIEQILMNVLVNAQRHSPADSVIEVRLEADRDEMRLEIEDRGQGVDDAILARLGERLFRADASRTRDTGGSGLGLAIVRAIVERHDGALRFERAPQGGLRVCITLPRDRDEAA